MQFKNFSNGFRRNHIDINSLSAGQNIELLNTPYGRNIHMANGNECLHQINGEQIIGGFDYVKGDIHHHLIFTLTSTESKAYLLVGTTATLIKSGMSASARFFNGVNYNNGAFITNGIDAPFFYEYGATPAVIDVNAYSYTSQAIRGLSVKVFDNRIFMGSGSGLYSCGLGDWNDWSSSTVEDTRAGYIKNFMNSSATILAIETYKSSLIIHRTFDTVWLSGTSGSYEMKVISNVGAVNPFAVSNLDKFQAYFLYHPNGIGLYNLTANALGIIEPDSEFSTYIHEEFATIDTTRLNEIYLITDTKKNEIRVHIPKTDYPSNSYWLIYNLSGKFFHLPRVTQPILSVWIYNGNIYTGTTDGKILKEDINKTFDGTDITFKADTSAMDFDSLEPKECDEYCQFIVDSRRQNKFNMSFIANDNEQYMVTFEIEQVPQGCLIFAPNDSVTDLKYMFGQNFATEAPMIFKDGKPEQFNTLKVRFSGTGGDIGLYNLELPPVVLA